MMNFISHGTQDMYPTYLQRQLHYNVNTTALVYRHLDGRRHRGRIDHRAPLGSFTGGGVR